MSYIHFLSKIFSYDKMDMKFVFATFSLFCFVSLTESTCETRTNVFYFTFFR